MSEIATASPSVRKYWPTGTPAKVLTAVSGLLAILIAVRTVAYQPDQDQIVLAHQEHLFRLLSFAALTVWTTLAIGIKRRGAAAIITLGFAIVVEMILVPMRFDGIPTMASANLGIVFAYCGMHLYWQMVTKKRAA